MMDREDCSTEQGRGRKKSKLTLMTDVIHLSEEVRLRWSG
jgi:hypothetical protein